MWAELFEKLRRRMTCIYAAIFGVLILVVVFFAYTFIWWNVRAHEKDELVAKIYHEAEEWLASGEAPCSEVALREGSMLAYFVAADGETVILDQLGEEKIRQRLLRMRGDWPREMDSARILDHRVFDSGGRAHRYLAGVAPVRRSADGELVGQLYMFKDIQFYYLAALDTLFMLLCLAALLFAGAAYAGYLLAGRNIRPISEMYARQMQFTADASHEMRTPLAVLGLAAESLAGDGESSYSAFAKETLAILQSEIRRLRRLTENLMELARSDNRAELQIFEEADMTALCERTGQRMAILARTKNIELAFRAEAGMKLFGDEDALERLLVIVLDNAIKYSPAGTKIVFTAARAGGGLLLSVQDEGCGISDEDKEKVFQRFYRVDKARSREQGGLGLGLALAEAIVRRHHGTIKVRDNQPRGTIMEIALPA